MEPIYLDYNATTPLDPNVVEAMLPWLRNHFGNPSSGHVYGKKTREAIDHAREQVAALLGADPDEIIFTSGGTEANNHVIKGVAFGPQRGVLGWVFGGGARARVVTSEIEHPAILEPCEFLKQWGCRITKVSVDGNGLVSLKEIERAIRGGVDLVTIMHSNNEVGTLQPIGEIAKLCQSGGVLFHTDAAQSMGKVPVNVRDLGVDMLSVAGHKLYAPKGVGALYLRKGVSLGKLMHGADHESGRRAGTENVPYIVGLGEACRIAKESLPGATDKLKKLRDRLWEKLKAVLGDRVVLNGHPEERLPNTLNVNFVGHVGVELLESIPEIAASTGAACHAGQVTQSSVLCAMKVPPEMGKGAVRLTVGRFTTEDQIDQAAELLCSRCPQ